VVNRVKTFLTPSLITIQNLLVFPTAHVHLGPKNFVDARTLPLGDRCGDRCEADPLETRFSVTCITMSNVIILGQTIRAYLTEIHKKN